MRSFPQRRAAATRGLGADDLLKAATREHVEVPAGRLEGTMRESNVQVEGEAMNLEQMRHIVITVRNGEG